MSAFVAAQVFCFASTNVVTAGATGNGITDDTRAIQNAINSSPLGDTIVFPSGTYRISSQISVPSSRTLQGQSGATLKGPGGQFIFELPYDSASNITIDGLTLDGGGINTSGSGVPAYGIHITNCTFQNILTASANWPTHDAIFIPGGMTQSTIANNHFYNILEGGMADSQDRLANGIQGWRLNAVTISNNTFDTVNQGISLSFDKSGTYAGVVISGNTGTRIHRMGVEAQGAWTQGFTLTGNQFSNYLNPFWNTFGISMAVSGGSGTIIRNNIVDASPVPASGSRYGYGLEVSGYGTTVSGNTIRNAFVTGIAIGAAQNMVITGNYLCGSQGAMTISFEASVQPDAQIYGNTASLTCSTTVQAAAPVVTLTSPSANAIVSGKIQVSATATSTLSVASVSFVLDGGQTIGQAFTSPFNITWDTSLVADGAHTLKAIAVDANGNTGTSATISVTTQNAVAVPPSVPAQGLKLWLKGDAGITAKNGKVSSWADQSGSGIQATQSTANLQPALAQTGQSTVIRFDGVRTNLTFPLGINGWNGMTIFLVAANSKDSTGGASKSENAAIFWDETAWWGTTYLSPFQSNVAFRFGTTQTYNWPVYRRPASVGTALNLAVSVKSGSTDYLYLNGILAYSEGGKYPTIQGAVNLGALGKGYNNTFFGGDIAEVLVYNRGLSDSERQGVETYLISKYSLR